MLSGPVRQSGRLLAWNAWTSPSPRDEVTSWEGQASRDKQAPQKLTISIHQNHLQKRSVFREGSGFRGSD